MEKIFSLSVQEPGNPGKVLETLATNSRIINQVYYSGDSSASELVKMGRYILMVLGYEYRPLISLELVNKGGDAQALAVSLKGKSLVGGYHHEGLLGFLNNADTPVRGVIVDRVESVPFSIDAVLSEIVFDLDTVKTEISPRNECNRPRCGIVEKNKYRIYRALHDLSLSRQIPGGLEYPNVKPIPLMDY